MGTAKQKGWGKITIGGVEISPGERKRLTIPLGDLPTNTPMSLPVVVVHGAQPGPCLWVSAALHGDEINGVEIVRSLLERVAARGLNGTLIAVPVVNIYGFLNESRYLPDRRDLNRSFPGRAKGSLASRIAHLFMEEIVSHCTHGIDLHTAADSRTNYPQIRGNMQDEITHAMARAFNAPIMMHAKNRKGTIRKAATDLGLPVLLYEGGEPLRFDEHVIEVGREGILRVMDHLGMREYDGPAPESESIESHRSTWVRGRRAGIFRMFYKMGDIVSKGDHLGAIEDIFGNRTLRVKSPAYGMLVGCAVNPLIYQGDAIVHIAKIPKQNADGTEDPDLDEDEEGDTDGSKGEF